MNILQAASPLLIFAVAVHTASADTEFEDSVPLEVVMQFIGNPLGGESKLYSDIFAEFPPFAVPADLRVLASSDQGFVRRVVLATELDDAATGAAITQALAAEGWAEIPQYGGNPLQVGFVNTTQAVLAKQLCHDTHGMMTLMVTPGMPTRYVTLNHNVGARMMGGRDPSCAQLLGPPLNDPALGIRGVPGGFSSGMLNQYVPRLIMPQSDQPASPIPRIVNMVSTGGGGSSNEWETTGALTIDWSIDAVFEHFAAQVAEQGWATDSEVTGAEVATGSWTKSIDDMDLVGTLSVLNRGDDVWDLRFRIVRKGGGAGAASATPIGTTRIIRDAR